MLAELSQYYAGFTTGAIALRLILATVLGGLIGLERATKHHPAGMRAACTGLSRGGGIDCGKYLSWNPES